MLARYACVKETGRANRRNSIRMKAPGHASLLHPDRLFPADRATRTIARRLFASVASVPVLSPHGHTEAQWFADNQPFPNPTALFLEPDHYLFRMLYSQGISMEAMGILTRPEHETKNPKPDPREVWKLFAANIPPVPRNPQPPVARLRIHRTFRSHATSLGKNCGPLLRSNFRETRHARISSARPLPKLPA